MGAPEVKELKRYHTQMIRNVLLKEDGLTVREIATKTGLSIVTVGALLQRMSACGELSPPRQQPSECGRPACLYSYDLSSSYALILNGFHMGAVSSGITVQVVDLKGRIVHNDRHVVRHVDIEAFDVIIDGLLGQFPSIKTLGFVLPGEEYGGVVTCGDFEALNGISFTTHMEERYGLPVYFDNDVNAAVRGFCARRRLQETSVVYLYFPDGFPPGAGVFLNGDVYGGATNFAGELNFLPFDIDWGHPSETALLDYLHKLATTVCCLYNPAVLVLNGRAITRTVLQEVHAHCAGTIPSACVPELVLSEDILWDITEGAISGVLGLLNRPETFCKEV
jgi:hypothetical protein